MNESQIAVAANLPAGYLNCQEAASKVDFILPLLSGDGLNPVQSAVLNRNLNKCKAKATTHL